MRLVTEAAPPREAELLLTNIRHGILEATVLRKLVVKQIEVTPTEWALLDSITFGDQIDGIPVVVK